MLQHFMQIVFLLVTAGTTTVSKRFEPSKFLLRVFAPGSAAGHNPVRCLVQNSPGGNQSCQDEEL